MTFPAGTESVFTAGACCPVFERHGARFGINIRSPISASGRVAQVAVTSLPVVCRRARPVRCSEPCNVWAVGKRADPTGRTRWQPATMRFDGTAWQSIPTPEHRLARNRSVSRSARDDRAVVADVFAEPFAAPQLVQVVSRPGVGSVSGPDFSWPGRIRPVS